MKLKKVYAASFLVVICLTILFCLNFSKSKFSSSIASTAILKDEQDQIKVISSRSSEMMQFIKQFPYSDYHVKEVPCYGYVGSFYIDLPNDHVKNSLERGYAWENNICHLIVKHAIPGSIVIDIGAHIGTHTLTMAHTVGNTGRVFAFEPQPKIFRELFLNMQLNKLTNVSCCWGAVGANRGTIELSNLAPENEAGTPLVFTDISKDKWSYKVLGGTGTLVDLLPIDSLNLENVSLIKIDVEGMENAALDGAKDTILRNKPVILIEIMGGYIPETCSPEVLKQIEFTKDKLSNLGYEVTRINGWDYLAIPK